jgi:hypothetical protein
MKRKRPKRKRAKVTGTLHGTVTVAAELRGTVKPPQPGTMGGTVDVTAVMVGTTTPLIGVGEIPDPFDGRNMSETRRALIREGVQHRRAVRKRTKLTRARYLELEQQHKGNKTQMAKAADTSRQAIQEAAKKFGR